MTGSIILVRTYLVLYSVGKRKLLLLLVHPHDILILQLYSCYHTCLRAVVTITVYTWQLDLRVTVHAWSAQSRDWNAISGFWECAMQSRDCANSQIARTYISWVNAKLYPECCLQNTTNISCTGVCTLRLSFLAIFHNCHHSSSRYNLSWLPSWKKTINRLQHQEYTERHMTYIDNNRERKIAIQLTSVGVTHSWPYNLYNSECF